MIAMLAGVRYSSQDNCIDKFQPCAFDGCRAFFMPSARHSAQIRVRGEKTSGSFFVSAGRTGGCRDGAGITPDIRDLRF